MKAACPRPRCNFWPSSMPPGLREGRARLGEINRAINLAVRPVSDLAQYGQLDVWTSPLVTLTRRRRLRRLCDCEIRGLAPRRHRARRSADRDHARHHPRRGPRRCRRAARRPLADAGQPPHGDGRGFRHQELPADLRDRSAQRHAIRRCARSSPTHPAATLCQRPAVFEPRWTEIARADVRDLAWNIGCQASPHDFSRRRDLQCEISRAAMLRCSRNARYIPFGENMAIQIFSFCFRNLPLIDAVILTGIPSRQIR